MMSLVLEVGITDSAAVNVQYLLFLAACYHFRMYTVVLCIPARFLHDLCINLTTSCSLIHPQTDGNNLVPPCFPQLNLIFHPLNTNQCCFFLVLEHL